MLAPQHWHTVTPVTRTLAARSSATKLLIRLSLRLCSSQFCAHDNKQRLDLFLDWLNFPGKRKITHVEKRERHCVYDRSKRNRGYIKEWEKYAWFTYDN